MHQAGLNLNQLIATLPEPIFVQTLAVCWIYFIDFNNINDYIEVLVNSITKIMASITIRNLDRSIKEKLRVQAAKHGRSMEEEVRSILKETFAKESGQPENLAERIHKRFAAFGGANLPDIEREPIREPINFEE
jgi:plasmid stability protein